MRNPTGKKTCRGCRIGMVTAMAVLFAAVAAAAYLLTRYGC